VLKPTTEDDVEDQAKAKCAPGDGHSVQMKMFYLPFFAQIDPWIEFFNFMNEKK